MVARARSAEGQRWERRRRELLPHGWHRIAVADALGLSVRTLERYETDKGGPPRWYELALEGLAARKQKGQPHG